MSTNGASRKSERERPCRIGVLPALGALGHRVCRFTPESARFAPPSTRSCPSHALASARNALTSATACFALPASCLVPEIARFIPPELFWSLFEFIMSPSRSCEVAPWRALGALKPMVPDRGTGPKAVCHLDPRVFRLPTSHSGGKGGTPAEGTSRSVRRHSVPCGLLVDGHTRFLGRPREGEDGGSQK